MHILFAGNQGGTAVSDLNCAVAQEWIRRAPEGQATFVVWLKAEAERVNRRAPFAHAIYAYEKYLEGGTGDWRKDIDRLSRDYPETNWAAVIASERSFTDTSFLMGAGGNRREEHDYVQRILVNTVRFLESVFNSTPFDAVVCQTADSFFTHVLFKVAKQRGVRILALKPAWLSEDELGFAITNDEFMHSHAMRETYGVLKERALTSDEIERAEKFRRTVLKFDVRNIVNNAMGRRYSVTLSPNIRRLPAYLLENYRRDKELDYRRFNFWAVAKANILRLWRRRRTEPLLGGAAMPNVGRYVLFALHFQPEQSTLVGGVFYSNQVALAENLAKSLPLGWTLVVKEHPKGRGSRPAWQYRHLSSFPNVTFSDAPTLDLIASAGAVVTVTGTIAIEAIALDRPVVLLGKTYFDHADLLYRPISEEELFPILRSILVDRAYEARTDRHELAAKFFLSIVMTQGQGLPSRLETVPQLAEAIVAAMSSKTKANAG